MVGDWSRQGRITRTVAPDSGGITKKSQESSLVGGDYSPQMEGRRHIHVGGKNAYGRGTEVIWG